MNDLDSEKIAGNLSRHGMESAQDASEADLIIFNTCSVREKAVQKVYAHLGEIRRHKVRRPDIKVAVVGCMAQLEGERILERMPFVDIIAGPQKGHVIYGLFEGSHKGHAPVVDMRLDEDPAPLDTIHIARQNRWRSSVTISEGCNRNCSFCIVPLARGRERVRSSLSIIREVESLVAEGTIEILLLGQTVNSYFWRTYDRREIDLVEEREGRLFGFEIKWQDSRKKVPKDWIKNYPNSSFEVINQNNYLDFIL